MRFSTPSSDRLFHLCISGVCEFAIMSLYPAHNEPAKETLYRKLPLFVNISKVEASLRSKLPSVSMLQLADNFLQISLIDIG